MEKFWADDFDMDLLKIFPNIQQELGATASVKCWTVGHESLGRLNQPATWDGAFLWLREPKLVRDKNGWFNIGGRVYNDKEIECTWLEWLRDEWSHTYDWTVIPGGVKFRRTNWNEFECIMYHIRGWHKRDDIEITFASVWSRLIEVNRMFACCVESWTGAPFPEGTIPYYNAPRVPRQKMPAYVSCDSRAEKENFKPASEGG